MTYKAIYRYLDDSVHAEVLDFPSVISCGADLEEARRMLAGALVDMAETNLLHSESLPLPDPNLTDPDADLEEPIHRRNRREDSPEFSSRDSEGHK